LNVNDHLVHRLDIGVNAGYEALQRNFELAVPAFDRERHAQLIRDGGNWDDVVADVKATAPHDFLIYWKLDIPPLLRTAGHATRCCEYLMGNHVIAETMFRHDPRVTLYVPLRVLLLEDPAGATRFLMDQPSTVVASLGDDRITAVGRDLDQKVSALLTFLGAEAPVWPPAQ
jgi:hypothetical protein